MEMTWLLTRPISMILALSTSKHKCILESNHLDNDKKTTIFADPLDMEIPKGNATIIPMQSILENFLGWIDLRKEKN